MREAETPEFHDLTELGELCGCTEKQRKMAEGLLAGLSQTEAAFRAGYAGARDSMQLRSTASSTAQAKPVLALLALAESRGMGVPNAPGDQAELRRILWGHARSKDKQTSIRATVELDRIEREERVAALGADTGDLGATAAEIISELPHYGVLIACGLWFASYQQISNFPHIKLVAPLLANRFPEEWQRWRSKDGDPGLDTLAAGPVLSADELGAALKPAAAAVVRARSLIEREPERVDATA
jgi:hypothetical protein